MAPWASRGSILARRVAVAAGAAAFQDQRLLLVHRADDATWCLPGGRLEVGESLAECALRECLEETGCLWPLAIVPASLRVIGHLTPHASAMDGFIEVIGNRGSLGDIVPELVVLLGFAAVLLPLSVVATRRSIKTS